MFKRLGNDFIRVEARGSGDNVSLEIATADNGNEPILVRQYRGEFATISRTLSLLTSTGKTTIPVALGIQRDAANPYVLDVSGQTRLSDNLLAESSITVKSNTSDRTLIGDDFVEVGTFNGGVALTVEDGNGDASVTFNNRNQIPDNEPSAKFYVVNFRNGGSRQFRVTETPPWTVGTRLYSSGAPTSEFVIEATNINGQPNRFRIAAGGRVPRVNEYVSTVIGSSARITSSVDQGTSSLDFQLKDNTIAGSVNTTDSVATFRTTESTFKTDVQFNKRVYGAYFAAFRLELAGSVRNIAAKNIASIQFISNRIKIQYVDFVPDTGAGASGFERIRYAHTGMARSTVNSGINIVGPQGQGINNSDDTSSGTSYAFYGSTSANAATYTTQNPREVSEMCIVVHYIPSNVTRPSSSITNSLLGDQNNEIPSSIV